MATYKDRHIASVAVIAPPEVSLGTSLHKAGLQVTIEVESDVTHDEAVAAIRALLQDLLAALPPAP